MIYKVSNPILFLIFNRPKQTRIVFEEIRKIKPNKLYIAADGARKNKINDIENCIEVKKIVSDIDWDCKVFYLYREENLGCKYAVSSAITWFFDNEEKGIILEDDCMPCQDFFRFCDLMLMEYENDCRVRFITGSNFNFGEKRGEASYYFSRLTHVWGWASWRRAWKDYDVELSKYKGFDYYDEFKLLFNNDLLAEDWNNILNQLFENKIDTWDYQWAVTNLFNNGLSIIPNVNLIKNIGFDENATHTITPNGLENINFGELDDKIIHPKTFISNFASDLKLLFKEHNIENRSFVKKKKKYLFF